MPRTKIICTIGPASDSDETLRAMLRAGMDAARLNFSHGTHEEHARRVERVRRLAQEAGRAVAILQDLQGPKLRIGALAGGSARLAAGAPFTLTTETLVGDERQATAPYAELPADTRVGDRILMDDGLLELSVEETTAKEVRCRVVTGGVLGEHKGVSLPGTGVSLPALREKDREDVRFGLELGVDAVALSFVKRAEDVIELRELMKAIGREAPIIAKIEKGQALTSFVGAYRALFSHHSFEHKSGDHKSDRHHGKEGGNGILEAADGVMVARGDLGIEIPAEQVPFWQKAIIHAANEAGKPVITATQMLDSMIRNPRPTRAEATDVANAILDGSDAVMLSGETAAGQYPVESVEMMARIARETESCFPYDRWLRRAQRKRAETVTDAVSQATVEMAEELGVQAIITPTTSGFTARAVARHRPSVPIVAVTTSEATARRLALTWGVVSLVREGEAEAEELIGRAIAAAKEAGLVKAGERVVITAGLPPGLPGRTNMVQVREVE